MCNGINWLLSRNIDISDYVYLYMVGLGIKKWDCPVFTFLNPKHLTVDGLGHDVGDIK